MAEEKDFVCQFNNYGYCKFGSQCQKKHYNTVCELLDDCTENKCEKRHPKVCRFYSKNQKCRHQESCAYTHKGKEDKQTKVIGQITELLIKHEKDITQLNEEVSILKNLVQYMAHELVKHFNKEVESTDNEKNVHKEDIETAPPENGLKCGKCEYTTKNKNMLKKHMNTKHMEQKRQNDVKEHDKTVNFFCDECEFSCQTKNKLKKHTKKDHPIQVNNKESSIEVDHTNIDSENATDCQCTPVTVCDECLSEWIPKEQLARKELE